ncbi:alpha-amylase family glycosyl hydrolase [Undibacterium rugosum]|uniref:alpha-amylase family glycosyl hydrolase n=1 Tax=Undibacterium rugosum TaxID=2762291 RepID=UPI001E4E8227|nr:alpha-amylase family glycosyl hydrolase [Undibacterium rugosum]
MPVHSSSNSNTLLSACKEAFLAQLAPALRATAELRFAQHAPTLIARLSQLYATHFADDAQLKDWCLQLMQVLADALQARPAGLQKLDQQRSQQPDWFTREDRLGYCAYTDRFAVNLQGVRQRIPHLQQLGVTYLHLLPFLKARAGENDGGFAVSDFNQVEATLGSMQDLEQLTQALRESGISLCSDFILNHVADDHPWAIAARAGDAKYRDYFYHYPDRTMPDQFEATLGQVFPQVAPGNFSYIGALQSWVWTTFYPYQWDLNYSNPAVFLDMTAALLQLANRGIEVFRLDSTAFLWKRPGTSCMNQPEAHWILQCLRCITEITMPGVLLKAEAIVATRDLPAYLGDAQRGVQECHLAYHSSLMAAAWVAVAEQDTSLIAAVITGTPELPPNTSWLSYVRCHDDIGWNVLRPEASLQVTDVEQRLSAVSQFFAGQGGSFASGASFQASDPAAVHGTVGMAAALCGLSRATDAKQSHMAVQRQLLLYGLSFCFGGMPLIYMGDEFAQESNEDYRSVTAHQYDARWLHRPQWDTNLAAQSQIQHSSAHQCYASLQRLLQWRRKLPQLQAQSARCLLHTNSSSLLAFSRGEAHTPFVFIGNFSDQPQTVTLSALAQQLPSGQASGSPVSRCWKTQDGEVPPDILLIPAWSQCWLIASNLSATGVN